MKSKNYSQPSLLILWAIATTFALNAIANESLFSQVGTTNQDQFIIHIN